MKLGSLLERQPAPVVDISTADAQIAQLDKDIARIRKDGSGASVRIEAAEQRIRDLEGRFAFAKQAHLGAQVAVNIGDTRPAEVAALAKAVQDLAIDVQQAIDERDVLIATEPARAQKLAELRARRMDLAVPGLVNDLTEHENKLNAWVSEGMELEAAGRALDARVMHDCKLHHAHHGHVRIDSRVRTESHALANLLSKTRGWRELVAKFRSISDRLDRKEGRARHPAARA